MNAILSTLKFKSLEQRALSAIVEYLRSSNLTITQACLDNNVSKEEFYYAFAFVSTLSPTLSRECDCGAGYDRKYIKNIKLLCVDLETVALTQGESSETGVTFDVMSVLEDYDYLYPYESIRFQSMEVTKASGETKHFDITSSRSMETHNPHTGMTCTALTFDDGSQLVAEFSLDDSSGYPAKTVLTLTHRPIFGESQTGVDEKIMVTVSVFAPVLVFDYPNTQDVDIVGKTLSKFYNHPHKREDLRMSQPDQETLVRAAEMLSENKLSMSDIFTVLNISNESRFYNDFMAKHHCTPVEYRSKKHEEKREKEAARNAEPFDFKVVLNHTAFGEALSDGFELVAKAVLQIPFVVNENYEYTAYIVVTSGQCPVNSNVAFMKSVHREKFNALVVEELMPYYYGRVNIAYFQTLHTTPAYVSRHVPPAGHGLNYPHGYPGMIPGYGQPDFRR